VPPLVALEWELALAQARMPPQSPTTSTSRTQSIWHAFSLLLFEFKIQSNVLESKSHSSNTHPSFRH
jgi:hypothetical protein